MKWSFKFLTFVSILMMTIFVACSNPQPVAPATSPQGVVPAQAPSAPVQAVAPQSPAMPAAPAPAAPAAPAMVPVASPTSVAFMQPGAVPTRAARPAPAPSSQEGPSGTLVIGESDIAFPGTVPSLVSCLSQTTSHRYGVYEEPKRWDLIDPVIVPNLGESWSYDDTATVLTWKLKEGVQFHGGWGEMTSEDWKYSHEDMVADGSIHSNIFISKARVQEVRAVEPYTVQFILDKPNIFFIDSQFNGPGGCGSYGIVSKNRTDSLGKEEAHLDLSGGTGPFRFVKWDSGDQVVVEAVPDHHRKSSNYATLKGVEIKEQATKVAALAVGEVDIAVVPVTESERLSDRGLDIRRLTGGGYQRLYPQGRFCMPETLDGIVVDPYPRPGYSPDAPWVGECGNDAEEENARMVRWAMSMAINRQAIVDNILGGLGRPAGPAEMSGVTFEKYFQDKWAVPYDPDKSRQYISEAGWPNGFEATMRVTTCCHPLEIEMGEAIAKFMEDVGISVNIELLTYSANRPSVVSREYGDWWFRSSGPGLGLNPEIAMLRRNPVGAFNPGFEVARPLEIISEIDGCLDAECIDKLREAQWDWWHEQQQIIGVVETYGIFAVHPAKVGVWTIPIGGAGLTAFEYVQRP